jgi:hypothetical protein
LAIIKKSWRTIIILTGFIVLIYLGIRYLVPFVSPSPGPKSIRPYPVQYSYYQIIDEATGKTLTYISSTPVTVGDEYITGDNRRYVVVRLQGNKAYAKFAGMVNKK